MRREQESSDKQEDATDPTGDQRSGAARFHIAHEAAGDGENPKMMK